MKIIRDFIESGKSANGVGLYYGDKLAVRCSSTIGKQQLRQLERRGEIPSAFFRYLHERGVIQCPFRLNGKSISDLQDVLWNSLVKDGKRNEEAECLLKDIRLTLYPELNPWRLSQKRTKRKQ